MESRHSRGPLVAAHRGAWHDAPQNSLQALADAIELGCEMVEFDVRRTRDGRLVAIHDARVGGTAVAALDLEQLRERLGPGHAPLLEEMVELASGRISLNVELKEGGDRLDDVLAILVRHLNPDSFFVSSFFDGVLSAVHEAAPELTLGLLLRPGRRPRRLDERLAQTGASLLGLPAALARAGLLGWAASRGHASYVWTVNDRRGLRAMLGDERVSAVVTDRPQLALEVRRELAGPAG
jgi:glycerophosphoryl diester phosphodiesterase